MRIHISVILLTVSSIGRATPTRQDILDDLPNSLTLGLSITEVLYDVHEGYEVSDEDRRNSYPDFINSLALKTVADNFQAPNLKFDWALSPSLNGFATGRRRYFSRRDKASGERQTMSAKHETYGACTHEILNGDLNSTYGTLYAGVGAGVCVYRLRSENGQAKIAGGLSAKVLFGYRYFINDQLYAMTEADMTSFSRDIVNAGPLRSDSVRKIVLAFGYFFNPTDPLFSFISNP
ncbi:MAG: hypothetical protein EOP10_12600 [Proteobacteria bacterium]|nr:MAG: hypothetical protein EOP10_12600 [Pseudomonadota bacterium]